MNLGIKSINLLNIGIGVILFLATLSVILGFGANSAEARPFAYVTNYRAGTVSVIDTNASSLKLNMELK